MKWYTWVFSGIGGTVLIFLWDLFFKKRNVQIKQKGGKKSVQNQEVVISSDKVNQNLNITQESGKKSNLDQNIRVE